MQSFVFSQIPLEQLISEIKKGILQDLPKHIDSLHRPQEQEEILTRIEAARLLGISLPTLNEWTKKGKIKGYRISSRVRYKRSEVEQALILIKSAD